MADKNASSQNELFRMERSVLSPENFRQLSSLSGDGIPEALLEFICYEHQYNIFGYGLLDPVDFERRFRFSHNYLTSRHSNPYQLQICKDIDAGSVVRDRRTRYGKEDSPNEDELWLNRLENGFFLLGNVSLNLKTTAVLPGNRLKRQHMFIRILDSFSVIQDIRTGKVRYAYKLNDDFRRNLASLYLTISCDSIVALRKSGLQALYFYLVQLRDALYNDGRTSTDASNTPKFEALCRCCNISEELEPKYRKRNLNAAFAKVCKSTELDFRVEWVKGDQSERYTPIFHFAANKEFEELKGHYSRSVFRYTQRRMVAANELLHNLIEACPFIGDRYADDAEQFFYKWLQSEDPRHIRLMSYALERTFVNLGCGIPADIDRRIQNLQFHVQRRGVKGIDDGLNSALSDIPAFKALEDRNGAPHAITLEREVNESVHLIQSPL